MMKKFALAAAALAFSANAALAYQVTGPVVAIDDSKIVVQKGSEKWEIARGAANVPADVKIGSKVTIEYSMTASKVEAKDAPKTASKEEKPAKAASAKEMHKTAPAAR